MLLNYRVSNFKSIGHAIEFSMLPIEQNEDERFLKEINTKIGPIKVLKRGGIFGPNAAGKSSFIKSLKFVKEYVVDIKNSGRGTRVVQNKGDFEDLDGKSTFQLLIYVDEEIYDYGFTLDEKQVYEEWLMILTDKGFKPMFSRTTNELGKTIIELGTKLGNKNSKDRKLAEILVESIKKNQQNQLFLNKLYENGITKVQNVVDWFKHVQIIFPNSRINALPIIMEKNTYLKEYIGDMLKKMDTGVFDIHISSREMDYKEFAETMDVPEEIIDDVFDLKSGILNVRGKSFLFGGSKHNNPTFVQVKFKHRINNKKVDFDIEDESDGTQRLLDLLPMLFSVGKNNSIYFIDEIDRSLHTKLSQYLLKEFCDISDNALNQIIYTAHDVNLINLRNFRKEEIWFVEKNAVGESLLRPLSDFDIETNQDPLKAYLNGRFGAVPIIEGEI